MARAAGAPWTRSNAALAGGRLHITQQMLSLAAIVEGALETMHVAAAAMRIEFDVEVDRTVEVLGDPDRLRQITWNLISKAIKFNADGGRVEVRVSGDAEHARLRFETPGRGLRRNSCRTCSNRSGRVMRR
jgi:signal transduction histidine kinase